MLMVSKNKRKNLIEVYGELNKTIMILGGFCIALHIRHNRLKHGGHRLFKYLLKLSKVQKTFSMPRNY